MMNQHQNQSSPTKTTYADVAAGRKTEQQTGSGGGNQANTGQQPAGGAGKNSQKMVSKIIQIRM